MNDTKVCTKCNVEKPSTEFSKRKASPDKLSYTCKVCKKYSTKEWWNNNKNKHRINVDKWQYNNQDKLIQYYKHQHNQKTLPYWIVYQLPNANNYVGQTNQPYFRMNHHQSNGRNTDNWIELNRCNTLQEALAIEAHYHSLGYPGENTYYNRNKTHLETLKTTN